MLNLDNRERCAYHMSVAKIANAMFIEFPRLKSVHNSYQQKQVVDGMVIKYMARRLPGIFAMPLRCEKRVEPV